MSDFKEGWDDGVQRYHAPCEACWSPLKIGSCCECKRKLHHEEQGDDEAGGQQVGLCQWGTEVS
jgi:hypothetical protein